MTKQRTIMFYVTLFTRQFMRSFMKGLGFDLALLLFVFALSPMIWFFRHWHCWWNPAAGMCL